jgi:hypothetical protein
MQTPSDATEEDEEENIALQSSPHIKREVNGNPVHHVIGSEDDDDDDDDDDRYDRHSTERTQATTETPHAESVQLLSVEDDTDWQLGGGDAGEDVNLKRGEPPAYDGLHRA